jgi:exodeoxyribonuclease VIII
VTVKKNVMVDLETLALTPRAQILSIGAVTFGPKGLGDTFYEVLELDSQTDLGREVDPKTVEWWSQQSPQAKTVLTAAKVNFRMGMVKFNAWVGSGGPENVLLWGNGAGFDNVILEDACRDLNLEPGWRFWSNRCFRTLKARHSAIPMEKSGIAHNALDDAKNQAMHALKILNYTGGWEE